MSALHHKTLSAVAIFAAALGVAVAGLPLCAQDTESPPVDNSAQSESTSQWQANDDDFLLLQLKVRNYTLTNDVRGYQTDRGVCLDLADVIQSLDLPVRIDKKSRRATGWLFSEDQKLTIDRSTNTVQNVNVGSAPVSDDIYDTPEGWCVDIDALSRWFGIDFIPDLYNASIRLESEQDLPFIQAIERKSRAARLRGKRVPFDLSQLPTADLEYRAWRTPSVDVVVQAGVETGDGTSNATERRVELYAAGEALGASYFARIATDDSLTPETVRVRAYRNDPDGGLLGPLQATEIAIGDVETLPGQLTGQTGVGRGAFLTNRPLGQTTRFSTTTLRGILPVGWDAELYRNKQLIAFQDDRGDGRYEFIDVELFFGRNDLEVILYGPQGQIRRDTTSVPVGGRQIAPGQTYYWAGIVQDDRDLIDLESNFSEDSQQWRWGAGVERGIDERTSAAVGAQSIFFDGARREYLEGALTRTFGALQLEVATAHELGAGSVVETNTLGRLGRFNFGANALVTVGNFASEFVAENIDYRGSFNFDTSLLIGRTSLPVQSEVSRTRLNDGSAINEFQLTTSVTAGRVALSGQFSHEERTSSDTNDGSSDTRVRLLANTRFRDFRVRGNATFLTNGPDSGLETANVRVDTNLGDDGEFQGQLEFIANTDEYRLTAGYIRRFDSLSLRADAFATSGGGLGAAVQLAFSLGPDPVTGGVRISNNRLARNGQAAVTVFRDDDGNGTRDPGEDVLDNVFIEAGLRTSDAVTGENGRAIVDDLRPFRPIVIGIDEGSLDDPFLAPSGKGVVVTPRPGIVAQIELGISPTGEVEGTLLSSSGVSQPGVKIELIKGQGSVAATTISEFDGFFLFQRIPYGEYTLRVSEDAANTLQVSQQLPLSDGRTSFRIHQGEDVVRYGTVKLQTASSSTLQPKDPIATAPSNATPEIAAVTPG